MALAIVRKKGQIGKVSGVFADNTHVGTMVDYDHYVAKHGRADGFPHDFAVIQLTGYVLDDVKHWADVPEEAYEVDDPTMAGGKRTLWRPIFADTSRFILPEAKFYAADGLERRSEGSGRDTLRLTSKITRVGSEVLALMVDRG